MKVYRSVKDICVENDMWTTLSKCEKPIVMYGMGNGADKILAVFSEYGIEAADFFASDGFVRHQLFHGKTVMSYSEICEKYEDFVVVVSFGSSLPDVLSNVYRIAGEREVFVPDVPVVADSEVFNSRFFESHIEELERAYELFHDELSRRTFCDVIMYKLTGRPEYLRGHTVTPEDVMHGVLNAEKYREIVDLGAYNGDSIRALREFSPELSGVTAFEPDLRNYKKLCSFASDMPYCVRAYNCAAWDREEMLPFTAGGNRNSTLIGDVGVKTGAKIKYTAAARLDSLYSGRCDYIKYDVEGAEYEALCGSRETILREHPQLLVSMYHRSEDMYRLPLLLHELGYRRLYLRRYEYIPAWDLNLLGVE